jgi:hypothetical protein
VNETYLTPFQRIPGYLPYAHEVGPGRLDVPNEAFGFNPQGQFAPEFFPAGHASFQQYAYPDNQLVLYGDALSDDEGWDLKKVALYAGGVVAAYWVLKRLRVL